MENFVKLQGIVTSIDCGLSEEIPSAYVDFELLVSMSKIDGISIQGLVPCKAVGYIAEQMAAKVHLDNTLLVQGSLLLQLTQSKNSFQGILVREFEIIKSSNDNLIMFPPQKVNQW